MQVSGSLGSTNLAVNNGGVFDWSSVTALPGLSTVSINSGGNFNLQTDGTIGGLTGGGFLNDAAAPCRSGSAGRPPITRARRGAGTLSKIGGGTFTLNGGVNGDASAPWCAMPGG